jgi:hypothetical protein
MTKFVALTQKNEFALVEVETPTANPSDDEVYALALAKLRAGEPVEWGTEDTAGLGYDFLCCGPVDESVAAE